MLLLWAVLFALQVRQRFGALQASVAGRIAPLESIQAKDRLDWVQLPGRLLGRCELPKGYTAGCKPLLLERVHNVRECLGVLGMTEGDTINYKGEVCQIQRCQEGQDELVLTTTYGPMEVYSVLCEALKDLPGLSTSRSKRIYVGKEEDYWTTSAEMKQDLRSFFMPLAANWTVLELGSYRGYTTRALAETFASVIAVDASEAFLNSNRRYNADRRNIFFVHLHSRVEGLRSLRQNEVQVAMVDAEHEYASVYRDTNQLLRYFRPSLKYLIFDDFGTDPGVMRAVREFVQSGRLRVLGGVGRKPPWTYRDQVIDSWEGVICEVMSNQSDVPMQRILGKWYTWFMSNLWESDDVIEFQKAGSCATSRGAEDVEVVVLCCGDVGHPAPLPTTQPPATAPAHMLGPAGSPGSRPFSANPSSPYGSWDQLPAGPVDEDADPDFEEMVSDLRRSFVGWLKKAELETKQHRSELRRGRQAFEEEKLSVWQQFMAEKQREVEKIREDRRHAEEEMATHLRQVQTDIEEARSRISEERQRVEQEGSQRRRSVAHEYEKFRQEYGLFEADRQRLANPQLAAESTVDLNVGGTIFETTRSTLVQQSGSFLESLLSGRYQISRDRYGRIFLNRSLAKTLRSPEVSDPDHFRTILNFLRNPHTPPMPRDSAESEALVQEASFYGVHFFPFPLVFAVGGHDGYEHLRAMEVLDVGNQCWRPCRAMATERTYFGAATLRNRLHVFGGQNLDYKALCDVEIYDCLRDTWEAGSAMRFARRNCGCCELEGRIYAIGGFDGTRIIDSVEAYDSRLKSWMQMEPLPTGRSSPMATVNGGKLWVLGGTSGTRLRTVDVFDPRANRWESLKTEMVDARSAGQAANCVHHVFAMGGTDNDHRIHFSAECLDPDDHVFTLRAPMQEARMDFAAAVISDSIMVTGGQNGSVLSSSEFYRPELDEWQVHHSPFSARDMRLYNADVDEAERNREEFEEFDEPEDEECVGVSKSFFDLRQRTLSGMDLTPAFRVVVLGLSRKLKNNTKDSIPYSEMEDALGRYFRVLDADMQRFANLHEILRDAADKAGAAGASLVGAPSAVMATHTAGINLLHDGMREIAVVLLACGEMQRQCLDLKLNAQRSISAGSAAPQISYSKYADFLDEALVLCDQLRRKNEELQQQRLRAMAKLTEAKLAANPEGSAPSHKPLSMGGSNPERPVLEAWRLQFDEEWEKLGGDLNDFSPSIAMSGASSSSAAPNTEAQWEAVIIGLGVGLENPKQRLESPVRDAQRLAETVKKCGLCSDPILVTDDVRLQSKSDIQNALSRAVQKMKTGSKLLVYFGGHCLTGAEGSQETPEREREWFQSMKNLPEAFLVEVFEACKRFEHHDAFAVREMLDEIGRCYQDGTPRVGNMLRLEEEIKPIWEQDPEVDLTYWFCCEKLGLSGGQADDLATCIYNGCRALKIEPHVLLAKGSVWVILIVHERLSRQQSATIAKLFDQFIQDRKKTSLSWMFATRPRRWSPLLVPPGLRQVVQFVRFLADELPPILLLNVRGVRPLVLNWLKRTEQHQHLKEWQLRTVYRGKDLGDDEWVQETYSLRYLICQDWTQWDDPELVNAVMKTVLQLPKKRRGCEFLEGRVGAELAYLYKAMNATMNVPQVDTIRELLQTSTLSPRALVRRLVTAFLELQTVEPKQEQLKMQPEDVPEGLILQPQDDSWRKVLFGGDVSHDSSVLPMEFNATSAQAGASRPRGSEEFRPPIPKGSTTIERDVWPSYLHFTSVNRYWDWGKLLFFVPSDPQVLCSLRAASRHFRERVETRWWNAQVQLAKSFVDQHVAAFFGLDVGGHEEEQEAFARQMLLWVRPLLVNQPWRAETSGLAGVTGEDVTPQAAYISLRGAMINLSERRAKVLRDVLQQARYIEGHHLMHSRTAHTVVSQADRRMLEGPMSSMIANLETSEVRSEDAISTSVVHTEMTREGAAEQEFMVLMSRHGIPDQQALELFESMHGMGFLADRYFSEEEDVASSNSWVVV
ncbi:Kelch-like protein 5 [Durusdinium trenchii]|uniref:Kelch-like protein 5 n=1 Tax=Durusdinium trenchii TaxID=1381693 RepID=A0ABP0H5J8_9DINO